MFEFFQRVLNFQIWNNSLELDRASWQPIKGYIWVHFQCNYVKQFKVHISKEKNIALDGIVINPGKKDRGLAGSC